MNINDIHVGMPVAYVSPHLQNSNVIHRMTKQNLGIVHSIRNNMVFVKYWTTSTPALTDPKDLFTLKHRPEKVEQLAQKIGVEDIAAFLAEHCDQETLRLYNDD